MLVHYSCLFLIYKQQPGFKRISFRPFSFNKIDPFDIYVNIQVNETKYNITFGLDNPFSS